jgi:mRNA-degrading endonuclease RelE of RelBE toxin-antitoxin system
MRTTSDAMVRRAILIGPAIWDELDSFDKNLKSKFIRAFRSLSRDISHPSLQVEYVKAEGSEFYRARVDPKYRFHFERHETHYVISAIGPHRLQGVG